MGREVGHTPRGNRVTLESETRVEGPGPHVFVYDKEGRRYRVAVPSGKTAEQVADDLVSGAESDRWITDWGSRHTRLYRPMGDLLCQLARSRLLEPTSELATRQGRSGLSVLAEVI